MKPAKRLRGGSSASGNLGKGRVVKSGKTIAKPPRLKPGQVRCHACRNAVTLTTRGAYRAHSDLFGGPCDVQRPQGFTLDTLPPVVFRGELVTPGLDKGRPVGTHPKGSGSGVRASGDCETCGAVVSGERRFCGVCLANRMSRRAT